MTKEEREERREYLMQIVRRLPEKPGSYQYYDRNGDIIYVGKAKNLRYRHTFTPKLTDSRQRYW